MFDFGSFLFGINVGILIALAVFCILLAIKKRQAEKKVGDENEV